MRKPTLIFKTTLLIVLIFILTSSAAKFMGDAECKEPKVHTDMAILVLNPEEIEAYNKHKEQLEEALKAYFDKAIASGDIVGAGVSIVKGDSIVVSNGFGKRTVNSAAKVDGETVFRLGSLSKGFTGILAANLKSEGTLSWQDKVCDFVPGFKLGDQNNTNKVTLANVLSHSTGTPYHCYTDLVESGWQLKDIAKRFSSIKPISKPGASYSYQNAMFALSSEMMYKATGEDMKTSLNKKFFIPLGMSHTFMDHETVKQAENIALPHAKSRYGWRALGLKNNYYNALAAGGISSSPNDMGKWMRFLLGHNPDVMEQSYFKEAFQPFVDCKEYNKYYQRWPGHVSSHYGFGWRIHKFVEDEEEKTVWHHGGSVNSYRNEIALYPQADLGICVLLNSNSKLAATVIPDLYKIVKDIYNQPNHSMAFNHVEGISAKTE